MNREPNDYDRAAASQSAALALDILQNKLHFPLVDGKINREKIDDQIVIGMYAGELGPLTQEIVDLACDSIQDLMDEYDETGKIEGLE